MNCLTRKLTPLLVLFAATAGVLARAERPDASPAGQGAEATKPADQETVVALELTPAAPPDPALKYALIPHLADRTPGNAAPLYLNAFSMLGDKTNFRGQQVDFAAVIDEHMEKPLAELKADEFQTLIAAPGALGFLSHAARRERAGWDTTLREEGFQALLPYLNKCRFTAQFLAFRARVQLAHDQVPDAFQTAQLLFGLSNHLGEDAVLIQSLVGSGVARLGLTRIVEPLIQHPSSPNLYWALASLPKPMFDMRTAMAWERIAMRASIPSLRYRNPEELSPAEWTQVAQDISRLLIYMSRSSTSPTPSDQIAATAVAVTHYPRAKQQLIELGHSPEAVDAMPAPQVIGIAMLHTFDHWTDEVAKWSHFPYYQAAPHLAKTTDDLLAAKQREPLNPAFMFIPALQRAYLTLAQVDRHVAALQTVEALRAYAASHNNAFPQSLDQLTDTPAPIDPTTGKPFAYSRTSDTTAEFSSPVPAGEKRKNFALRYTLKLRAPSNSK